jgi:transcription factor IIIB subunit 2
MAPKCCPKCFSNEIDSDGASGESVCTNCGHVLEECAIVSEVQFSEGAGGQSSVVGQFVPENGLAFNSGPGFGGFNKDSREITLANGKRVIQHLAGLLRLNTNHGEVAHRFFQQVSITSIAISFCLPVEKRGGDLAALLNVVCHPTCFDGASFPSTCTT